MSDDREGRPLAALLAWLPRRLLVLAAAGFFLGWNVPNHVPPWATFHSEMAAALGTACALAAALVWTRGFTRGASAPASARVWLALGLLPAAQLACGLLAFHGDALLGALYAVGVALAIVAGHAATQHLGRGVALRGAQATLVAAGLFANAIALGQWLGLGPPGWWAMELIDGRPYGNLGQANHFGLLMTLSIVALIGLYESGAIQRRSVLALGLACFGVGIAASGSRAAVLAALALALAWLATRHRIPTRLRLREVAATAAAGLGLLMAVAIFAPRGLGSALTEAAASSERHHAFTTSAADQGAGRRAIAGTAADAPARDWTERGAREAIWAHFAAAIAERPWAGYGFNQGVAAMAAVADRVQPSRNVTHAHNVALDLMVWFGVPAGAVLMLAATAWIAAWWRRIEDRELAVQRCTVGAAWLALWVQSQFEYPYAHAFFLLPLAWLAGAVAPSANPATATAGTVPAGRLRVPAMGWSMLAVVTFAVLLAAADEYLRAEERFRQLRFARTGIGPAMTATPHEAMVMFDQLAALNASAAILARPGMALGEIEALGRVAHRFTRLSSRIEYAKALQLNGRTQEARAELAVIRSISAPSEYQAIEAAWRTSVVAAPPAAASGAPPSAGR